MDEAVARALDEKVEKPDRIALEPWLYRLALRSLDDSGSRPASGGEAVDIQGLRRRRTEPASDEARLQFYQPDDALTTESGIADERISTPEQIAYSDEMIALVQFALSKASRQECHRLAVCV